MTVKNNEECILDYLYELRTRSSELSRYGSLY